MKDWRGALIPLLFVAGGLFADEGDSMQPMAMQCEPKPVMCCEDRPGWSLSLGGQYTWMSFESPPTFKGSTGGGIAKLTYETSKSFFGEWRNVVNAGTLSASSRKSNELEWYSEFVAGYTFAPSSCWMFTPYAGVGFDYLKDKKHKFDSVSSIDLKYRTYYTVIGFDTHYMWDDWSVGLQGDCLPVCNQFLSIGGLSGAAWKMKERVGWAARLPIGCKISSCIWVELTPYYRFFPIGESDALGLPHRNLNQWGGFLTFRFFL